MKNAFKIILVFLTLHISGCATYVAKQSWDEARAREAIRIEADGESVMVGVDLLSTDYLKDNWKVALPAAALDGFLIYQTYQWVQDQNDNGGSGDKSRGDGSTSLNLSNSNNNTISVVSGTDNDSNQDREVGGMNNSSNLDQDTTN